MFLTCVLEKLFWNSKDQGKPRKMIQYDNLTYFIECVKTSWIYIIVTDNLKMNKTLLL